MITISCFLCKKYKMDRTESLYNSMKFLKRILTRSLQILSATAFTYLRYVNLKISTHPLCYLLPCESPRQDLGKNWSDK
nr:MAG TPA: hypothetical protein [Caudoviricetes sp.]